MKLIKHFLLLSFLCLTISFTAQNKRGSSDKIKAFKVAYITNELNLTAREAQQFWPIYNLHSDKLHELREEYRRKLKNKVKGSNGVNNLSESEAKQLVRFKIDTDKKINKEELQMTNELIKVISYKKIIKLQIAELEFRRKLIGKLRGRPRN